MRPRWTLVTLAVARIALGQEPDPHAAIPERPTVATHAYTIAPGWSEIETGVEFDRLGTARTFSTPTTFKVGLASHLQVEISSAYVQLSDSAVVSGAADLVVALKWRIADSLPIIGDFAIQPAVRLPTASANIGSSSVVGSILLISSQHYGPVEVDANIGLFSRLSNNGEAPYTATLWTVSAGSAVVGPLGWTAEVFGYPGTSGASGSAPLVGFLTGPTCIIREWFVGDAGIMIPLAGPQPHALYAGLTWNLGRLWKSRATAPSPSP